MNIKQKDLRLIFGSKEEKQQVENEKKQTLLFDFSGLLWANYFTFVKSSSYTSNLGGSNYDFLAYLLFNGILATKKIYSNHKDIVLAMDKGSWRNEYFKFYKAKRKMEKSKKSDEFELLYEFIDEFIEYVKGILPYKFIEVPNAEADDVIGTLTYYLKDKHNSIVIVSRDKDFKQLLKFDNIKIFDPIDKKEIEEENPHEFLINHIINGDRGDGIPNVFSDDNIFLSGKRQKPFTKKKKEELIEKGLDNFIIENGVVQNYERNRKLIELSTETIPEEIQNKIILEYTNYTLPETDLTKLNEMLNKYDIKALRDRIHEFLI